MFKKELALILQYLLQKIEEKGTVSNSFYEILLPRQHNQRQHRKKDRQADRKKERKKERLQTNTLIDIDTIQTSTLIDIDAIIFLKILASRSQQYIQRITHHD